MLMKRCRRCDALIEKAMLACPHCGWRQETRHEMLEEAIKGFVVVFLVAVIMIIATALLHAPT